MMFDIKKDIQAMTTFRRNPGKFMKHLKKTKKPLILTINGKAEAVVQDAEAYQRLRDNSGASRRFGGYPPRPRRWEKRPRTPGARSPGNAPARPCHTSLGLPSTPARHRVTVIPEIRNFAIGFLAVSQTSTGSSTRSTNATLRSTFFTFATAHGLRLQLNEWFLFPECQTFIN